MNRKEVAKKYFKGIEQGEKAPCFVPDFSFDNKLYEEIGGLNEISIAMSKHSLKDTCQVRLQEVPSISSPSLDDDVQFDNITPKSMDVSELMFYAHSLESEILNSKKE